MKFSNKISLITLAALLFAAGFLFGNQYSNAAVLGWGQLTSFFNSQVPEKYQDIDFDTLWQAWEILDDRFVETESGPTNEEKVYGLIRGLASSYDDPYTVFLTPEGLESFNESVGGSFSGVGMEIGVQEGFLRVVAPLKGTPAELAGVKSGDVILEIDGINTQNLSIDEAIQKIRGPIGTTVELTLLRRDLQEPLEISIIRDEIQVPVMETEIIDDVFVVRIFSFSSDIGDKFKTALKAYEASSATGLILDLRNNPGGYLNGAVDVAGQFTQPGQVIVKERFQSSEDSKSDRLYRSDDSATGKAKSNPVVVLVNGGSASASEIVAGALDDYDIALLIGEDTFGKGSVQELVPLRGKSALKVTVARWLTPEGRSLSNGGLVPDIIVSDDPETPQDEQLEAAIENL